MSSHKQVYLAAPCFSSAERRWNADVKSALEIVCPSNFEFYLPQDRVTETWPHILIREELIRGIFTSHFLVANLDGPGGDDGTCWEMGFMAGLNATANNQLSLNHSDNIFWYRTDFRNGGDSNFNVNLMMAYGGTPITFTEATPSEVAKSISRALIERA